MKLADSISRFKLTGFPRTCRFCAKETSPVYRSALGLPRSSKATCCIDQAEKSLTRLPIRGKGVSRRVDTDSYHEFGTGRFLARAFMKYGWDLYAPDEKTRNNPYVSPLRASNEELQDLPPALVITSENDPLRDEGEAYARRLKDAGVAVTATRYNGMIHDFVLLNAIHDVPGVQAAIRQANDAIRDTLKP